MVRVDDGEVERKEAGAARRAIPLKEAGDDAIALHSFEPPASAAHSEPGSATARPVSFWRFPAAHRDVRLAPPYSHTTSCWWQVCSATTQLCRAGSFHAIHVLRSAHEDCVHPAGDRRVPRRIWPRQTRKRGNVPDNDPHWRGTPIRYLPRTCGRLTESSCATRRLNTGPTRDPMPAWPSSATLRTPTTSTRSRIPAEKK